MATNYKIVKHLSSVELAKLVNEALEDGWILYGNPFTQAFEKTDFEVKGGSIAYICQALIYR